MALSKGFETVNGRKQRIYTVSVIVGGEATYIPFGETVIFVWFLQSRP